MNLPAGPFPVGAPAEYARRKANLFPDEGGAVIVVVDVPDEILNHTDLVNYPLRCGLVEFEPGYGLEELQIAWPALDKRIAAVE